MASSGLGSIVIIMSWYFVSIMPTNTMRTEAFFEGAIVVTRGSPG